MYRYWLIFYFILNTLVINAKICLPDIIGNNMVLQRNTIVKLWGKSTPLSYVKVMVSWNKETIIKTISNSNGDWSVIVKTPEAGGPYSIKIADEDVLVLNNILIGDVWICSGQSNMNMPVKGFKSQPVLYSMDEIVSANESLPIRMFTVDKKLSKKKIDNVEGKWNNHSGRNVSEFSAVGYFFGKELCERLNVPIGLISTSWGGSTIEAWMPEDILKMFPEISIEHLNSNKELKRPFQAASMLFNSMLYPLNRVAIKGFIWYQGESNIGRPKLYEKLFSEFIRHIRNVYNNQELPFYYAQIAPFGYSDKSGISSAVFREIQYNSEKKIPHIGMAVLMDIGDEKCIHPANKKQVGERLAYLALQNDYGYDFIKANSPRYVSKEIKNDKIILTFDAEKEGLTSFGKELKCFEISSSDKVFHPAKAIIQSNNVIVWNEDVKNPVAVRYAFKNYIVGDLFGTNGLPVSSFRTDF